MSFGRIVEKIKYKDGYVKKSEIFKALETVDKEYDYETGDYGSILFEWYICNYGEVCDAIDFVECEDVKPVVHARWFPMTTPDEKGRVEYCCDHCRKFISGTWNKDQKYCGACGARMDG